MTSKKEKQKNEKSDLEEIKKELEKAKKQLSECQKKEKEYLEGWQRERADFLNYKKNQEEIIARRQEIFLEDVLLKFLEVADNFELALKSFKSDTQSEAKKGFELIYQQLKNIFSDFGLEEIKIERGEEFNPEIAEAVMTEETEDQKKGVVLEVVRKGYLLKGRVLRPARVKVSK